MDLYFIIALLLGLIILSLGVAVSDYRFRRIPNAYLLTGLIYALFIFVGMGITMDGSQVMRGFIFALLGMAIGFFVLFPGYLLKQMAAGDVKFMAVIGFFLGPKGCFLALLIGAMFGGLWALVLAWRIGGLGHMFYNIKYMLQSAYLSGGKEMCWDLRSEKAIKMPYGVALAAGAIVVASEQILLYVGRIASL